MAADRMQPNALLPHRRELYYGGQWHEPNGGYGETIDPGTGVPLGRYAQANASDVAAAVAAAHAAFAQWRLTKPLERAAMLRRAARILRDNAEELALIDAHDCGNPVRELAGDAHYAAAQIDFFAGLVTEMKGETIPMGDGVVNMTVREPLGVCARIVAYNHPLMFSAGKIAAPLAAGNTVIIKPPVQAPLSTYRMMELFEGVFPPGVLNIVTGGIECGEALVAHPLIEMVTLIGSVPTGRAIAESLADRFTPVILELGGKNALVVYPDADLDRAIAGAVKGMNFAWCGQSCGSTSRLFVHESVYDHVLAGVIEAAGQFKPGLPTDPVTTMGAVISQAHLDKILSYIDAGRKEGARLVAGGNRSSDPELRGGFYVEPTIFADVTPGMTIAREEIFGPVLSVLKWTDEEDLFAAVNGVDYGLTAAVFTRDLATAHRAAGRIEAGYIWINNSSSHFLGAPFGGYKQSGIGREESIDEILSFTKLKNINITL